jgi:PAS domain S-box-containing protein
VACYLLVLAVTGLVVASAVWSERDRATRALQLSEERLHLALDSARMGIWYWSVETNLLAWDDNLRRIYQLAPGDPMESYEQFIARVHPDDREFVSQTVTRALQAGEALDYEFRIVLPDGRVRWIADLGKVGRDASGRPLYLTGVCMDVTDRRVSEEHLRQAHRMESVGRLAGGVAHETNNQMSVVLGATDFILRRADVSGAVRADVEHIRKAAERTSAVTAQLLAFSRRQILRPVALDLNLLVRNWETVLRRTLGEDCTVELRPGPAVAPILADPGQLEQVLLNLALNARDAMPRGGTLTVETFTTEIDDHSGRRAGVAIRPGAYVVMAVSDTGHGMDRETLSHVFEPFFTTKGVGHGTGLGLATVYGIVKQSGGYVWAYSEPDRGSTFKVYLPVAGEDAPAPAPPASAPVHAGRGESVLLVEDDPGVRQVTRRALEDGGFRVLEAANGRDALALLESVSEPIGLVLTDVVMPGMGGRELADRVEVLRPGTPVLFTSGYTDAEIVRRGLLDPAAAFIQKPFGPEAILRVVRERVDGASLRSTPAPPPSAAPDA